MKTTYIIAALIILISALVALVIYINKPQVVENNITTSTSQVFVPAYNQVRNDNMVATTTPYIPVSFESGQKMLFLNSDNENKCHGRDGFPAVSFLPKADSVFVFSNFETRLKWHSIIKIDDDNFLVCVNYETNSDKVGILYNNTSNLSNSIVTIKNGQINILVENILNELNKQGFNITENPDDIIFNPIYFSSKNNSIIIGKNRYGVGGSSSNPLYSYSLETGSFTELAISKYHHDMNGILTNPNSPYSVESGKVLVLLNFETDTSRVIYETLPNETLTSECNIGCKVENKWLSDDVLLFYVYYFDKKEYQKTGYRVEQYSLKQKRILDKSEWIGSEEDYVSKVTFFD